MEQPLSPLSYLFDLINYASLILLNKLSILFHPIIVWPCGRYYKVQGWAHMCLPHQSDTSPYGYLFTPYPLL